MFQFKQFAVDQTNCAMKINTDGVLLGAMVNAGSPKTILDIGTGTGVIALMLAQRFIDAIIDAVEIDEPAAQTAGENFNNSPFADRLKIYAQSISTFFEQQPNAKYDLIVTNPPFYTDSLKSPTATVNLAKHADVGFFEELVAGASTHLTPQGLFTLILPLSTAEFVKILADKHLLALHQIIEIYSYETVHPHRQIVVFGKSPKKFKTEKFVIYDDPNVYSKPYKALLKDFLTIF